MNTPSKEALEAASEAAAAFSITPEELAAIIDGHFSPLRQRAEQAEARVGELEFGLKHQCETCEMKSIFDGEHAYALKMQARVKELEVSNSELRESHAAIHLALATLEADCSKWPDQIRALRAANAELKKQEAESRRLFYAEQDKRQSAEFRCEELAGALQVITDLLSKTVKDFGGCDHSVGVCMCEEIRACDNANNVLARHAAGEPAKHPDTELIDRFEEMCGSLEYCDADEVRNHWRAYGYSGSNEGVGRTMRDALRAAIAARMEVQP